MRLCTKRVYDMPAPLDGRRILVDRLWPWGLSKDAARSDYWARAVTPSRELRQWYRHDTSKWAEFRRRYFGELDVDPNGVAELCSQLDSETTILLLGSKERHYNNASALIASALAAVFLVNFGFWVGSLWGERWGAGEVIVPDWAFAVLWALALMVTAIWAWRRNRRWTLNTVATFAGIHFYTEWFERLGASPGSSP